LARERIDSENGSPLRITEIDPTGCIETDPEDEAARVRDLLDCCRVRIDSVHLARLPAGVEEAIRPSRDTLGMVKPLAAAAAITQHHYSGPSPDARPRGPGDRNDPVEHAAQHDGVTPRQVASPVRSATTPRSSQSAPRTAVPAPARDDTRKQLI